MTKVWPLVSLKDFAKPISRPVLVISGKSYPTIGVKWWGKGAYRRDTIDGSQTAARTLNLVKEGDLVINKIWVRHGSVAIATNEVDNCTGSSEFPTFELDLTKVLPGWLHWQVQTKEFWAECSLLSQGTSGKNRIKPDLFLTIKILLPPLDEQRRIVARIEELAAKVEQARELRQQAMTQANAFVSSLHLKLAGSKTSSVSKFLVLDEEREEVIPGRKYPQIGVKVFGQGLFAKEATDATQTTYKWFNRLYDGAIVLSQVKGWEGAIAVCPLELAGFYASPEYRTFRCVERQAISQYLASIFATPWFWSQLKNVNRGVGGRRQRTRPEQFLAMEIPMPSIERQQQAVKIFKQLEMVKSRQAQTIPKLEALMPSILDKAFKGEL